MPNRIDKKEKLYGNCLRCGKQFRQESKFNRICPHCTVLTDSLSKRQLSRNEDITQKRVIWKPLAT